MMLNFINILNININKQTNKFKIKNKIKLNSILKFLLKINFIKFVKFKNKNIVCYLNEILFKNNKKYFLKLILKKNKKLFLNTKFLKKNKKLFLISNNYGVMDNNTSLKKNKGGLLLLEILIKK